MVYTLRAARLVKMSDIIKSLSLEPISPEMAQDLKTLYELLDFDIMETSEVLDKLYKQET